MAVEKSNIFLSNTAEAMPFASRPRMGGPTYPERDRNFHVRYIKRKLQEAFLAGEEQRDAASIRHKDGVYLEFAGSPGHGLAIQSLENRAQGIRLLNVRIEEPSNVTKATIYIPAGKESYFLKKLDEYATKLTPDGKPRNNDLIRSIEDIRLAILESFWIGNKADIPASTPVWCELWLYYKYSDRDLDAAQNVENQFLVICDELDVQYNDDRILFPERVVKLIRVNRKQLNSLLASCPDIAEIRRAQEPASFFVNLTGYEQKEWIDDLLERTHFQNKDLAVCILDTGLAFSHPLIKKAVDENHVTGGRGPAAANDGTSVPTTGMWGQSIPIFVN